MGIVNVTPDSFSDGGKYFSTTRAVEQAHRLAEEGADILDIGGESTRPYSDPVAVDQELDRVVPVLRQLCAATSVPVSIDTSKALVAEAALAAGAQIINDVTGLTGDPRMLDVALHTGAGVCAMHMQGTPRTMQDRPTYRDVVQEVLGYLRQRRDALEAAGVPRERICLDPGIGFGKTVEHNLALIRQVATLHQLDCPLLVGHSRKGFLAKLAEDADADTTATTIGIALALSRQGIQVLRVHDVKSVRQALLLFELAGGLTGA
jgi:dihydropteroate synthase